MISTISSHLVKDGVIIHPTDTVFGISCAYLSKKGYDKIFELKRRPLNKPLGILLAEIEQIPSFTSLSLEDLEKMIPFLENGGTLLLPINSNLPKHLLDQSDHLGIRIPNHEETKRLIKEVGPLLATSANLSGEDPITSSEDARRLFPESLIIEGSLGSNTHSTILKYTPGGFIIIREGHINF